MPPDSGQGVSCAAEDAVALGLLLKHYHLLQDLPLSETLAKTAKAFEAVRMKRVWKILDIAKKRGDQKKKKSPWEEWIRDWIMWFLCTSLFSVYNAFLQFWANGVRCRQVTGIDGRWAIWV